MLCHYHHREVIRVGKVGTGRVGVGVWEKGRGRGWRRKEGVGRRGEQVQVVY